MLLAPCWWWPRFNGASWLKRQRTGKRPIGLRCQKACVPTSARGEWAKALRHTRGVRFASALAVRRLEMQLSEIQLIAVVAEKACSAAVNHPRNKDLREDLFDLLGPVAKLAQVDGTTYSPHLHDLLRQTGVWADIVRCRIENSRSGIVATPLASIRHPARDLQHLLCQLVGELQQPPDV